MCFGHFNKRSPNDKSITGRRMILMITSNRKEISYLQKLIFVAVVAVFSAGHGLAADWPMYRYDTAHSATTNDPMPTDLHLQWRYIPAHPPEPAWPMPAEELPRMHVDNAYHVAVSNGRIFVGCSRTDKIYALDAETGERIWRFYTNGPVRFAPTAHEGRVFAGSDDGNVYCLDAEDGTLIWKYRAGYTDEKVIGNGRMISLWPVRTNVLVDNGVVYFAAGVFPYEGLYICALRCSDGSVVWVNDTIGDYAHALQYGGMSPHGYLLASQDALFVPSGRAMPAAFNKRTGEFLYYASPGAKRGGVWALIDKDRLVSGVDYSGTPEKVAYDTETGERIGSVFAQVQGIDMVISEGTAYVVSRTGVVAIHRQTYAEANQEKEKLLEEQGRLGTWLKGLRKQYKKAGENERDSLLEEIDGVIDELTDVKQRIKLTNQKGIQWYYPADDLSSVILSANIVYVGGENLVIGIDKEKGKEVWRAPIQGKAVGLAASDGRLIVSSDEGPVYCFSETQIDVAKDIEPELNEILIEEDERSPLYSSLAQQILARSTFNKGYCLVYGGNVGNLASEIAQNSQMKVVAIEKDIEKLQRAREQLDAVNLLGTRIAVEPWDLESLPDYFANLIVCNTLFTNGKTDINEEEQSRVLRPWGGVLCTAVENNGEISIQRTVRGEIEGAGAWNQQYCDPQNTSCSGDKHVYAPLGMLWFGEPGPRDMVERHGRAQSPVAMNGRIFMQGEEVIMAVDAFNGTLLWRKEIAGAVRVKVKDDGGNLALTEKGLFVAAHDKCYRLDPATGETIRVYTVPPSDDGVLRRWGYISVDGDILYGSAAEPTEEEYGFIVKTFLRNGKWRDSKEIPEEERERYLEYKTMYPNPEDFYLAVQRAGTLYRSMTFFPSGGEFTQKEAVTENVMTSNKVFAMEIDSGELLWSHKGKQIAHITIALGDGKIFFADCSISTDQKKRALEERRESIRTGRYAIREGIEDELKTIQKLQAEAAKEGDTRKKSVLDYLEYSLKAEMFENEHPEGILTFDDADVRIVTALDARTGEKCWEASMDFTGCCGDRMGAAFADDLLLFFGNHGNHDAWRFREGGMKWRRITALSAETGKLVWSKPLNYRTRPVIVDDKIILEPRACSLQTGETITRANPITGEQVPWEFLRPGHTCGITSASEKGIFYRSACTNFYDLERDSGVEIFGAYRPGCAISLIPACGLLLSQEAAAGCTCSYPIRCSFAMNRKPERVRPWTVFVTPGDLKPVKHFAINFGAPADRKDNEGAVWFAYPNPKTDSYTHFPNYGVKFDLSEEIPEGMGYFARDFKGVTIDGTDKPWLFTSGCVGMRRCELPLIKEGDEAAAYTVRLGFMPQPENRSGERVFDIKLQNRVVSDGLELKNEQAETALIKEFKEIQVKDNLVVELVPRSSKITSENAPVINFIEVIREERT